MLISATDNLTNSRIYFGKSKHFIEPGMENVSIPDDSAVKEMAEFYASEKGGKLIKIVGAKKRAPVRTEQASKPKTATRTRSRKPRAKSKAEE
jgi:topoisomerase IA-like protein